MHAPGGHGQFLAFSLVLATAANASLNPCANHAIDFVPRLGLLPPKSFDHPCEDPGHPKYRSKYCRVKALRFSADIGRANRGVHP